MGDELKSKLESFASNVVTKIEKKELIPEIQQEFDELIELLEKLTILTYEESLKLENEMNNNEILIGKFKNDINSLQEQIKTYEEKIKSLEEELSRNSALEKQCKQLDDDYNILKTKRNDENKEKEDCQIKLKNNEKLINDLQGELKILKK